MSAGDGQGQFLLLAANAQKESKKAKEAKAKRP